MAIARVATRVRQGGHSVPIDTIRRRYSAGLRNLFRLYLPVVDSWMLFDNSSTAARKLIACQLASADVQVANQQLWKRIEEQYR